MLSDDYYKGLFQPIPRVINLIPKKTLTRNSAGTYQLSRRNPKSFLSQKPASDASTLRFVVRPGPTPAATAAAPTGPVHNATSPRKLTPNKSITGRSSSVRHFEPWRATKGGVNTIEDFRTVSDKY